MASISVSFSLIGGATAITFTPINPEPQLPVASGTVVGTISVTPAGWSGTLTLSGSDGGLLAISGTNVVVGSAALTQARSYSFGITATP